MAMVKNDDRDITFWKEQLGSSRYQLSANKHHRVRRLRHHIQKPHQVQLYDCAIVPLGMASMVYLRFFVFILTPKGSFIEAGLMWPVFWPQSSSEIARTGCLNWNESRPVDPITPLTWPSVHEKIAKEVAKELMSWKYSNFVSYLVSVLLCAIYFSVYLHFIWIHRLLPPRRKQSWMLSDPKDCSHSWEW